MQPVWGRMLQERREARTWSIRWAAKQAGMSDVFWAQMERGWKRAEGKYLEVTPSLGSLLQAASALRMSDRDTDDLIVKAGHPPLPKRYTDGARPLSVIEAVENDPDLIEEARAHLLNQYDLLRRLTPSPSVPRGKQIPRRTKRSDEPPLRAVARGGDPAHREQVSRMARRVREQQTHGEGTEDST